MAEPSPARTRPLAASPAVPRHWLRFAAAALLAGTMFALYGVNIARWRNSPDFGWRTMYDSGPNVVAEVFEGGRAAGLRAGDTITAINGHPYRTFEELFFGDLRDEAPASLNTYTVRRDGATVDVTVPTGRLGLRAVLWRSGPLFAMALVYVLIGVLVFLMKPRARESWLFLVMTCFVGIRVGFAAPADLIRPTWLYDLRFLNETLLPASLIHLALVFPRTHPVLARHPRLAVLPYVPSFAMFAALELTASAYWNIPRALFLASQLYTLLGIVTFLGSMARNFLRDASLIVRLQSQVIFAGILLAFLIPTTDLMARFLWRVYFFPDPALSFAVFLSLFPLSIGYTIVKHDLFAIDVIVRRTYGYVLSTASIVGAYALVVSTLNLAFQGSDVARSPAFSIGFALAVVFLFQPLHARFQRLVDRLFYRQRYDYRKTIKTLSEALTSILDQGVIVATLVGSVVREMLLENAVLFLRDPAGAAYRAAVVEGPEVAHLASRAIGEDDALVGAVKERKDILLRHDVLLNPAYEPRRERLDGAMHDLASELVIPLVYKDQLRGLISLGRKKSGKMFTPEDLDLLRTVAYQGAIALENAQLFEENLVKGRMEEELRIAHDIQLGMLPDVPPAIEGLRIAARSLPAREVGGDFYDFVVSADDSTGARVGIIVGDVSGKGVSGALLMSAARSTYRVLLETRPSVAEVMHLANQRLHRDIRKGMFVALVYAVFDAHERTLTVSNAGQTQPILCRAGQEPAYVETEGDSFPLGILSDSEYREARLAVKEGDILIFYTDGIVEAMNADGELYGFERLMASVREGRDLDAEGLLDKLMADVAGFVGGVEQHDDLTLVVARVT